LSEGGRKGVAKRQGGAAMEQQVSTVERGGTFRVNVAGQLLSVYF
jgi:hypothetical protein